VLRVSGYLCGKITKIGSTYLAGQGLFPLDEWKALLADESVMSFDRSKETPVRHGSAGPLDYAFHRVIGALGSYIPRRSRVLSTGGRSPRKAESEMDLRAAHPKTVVPT
jgi:hypothetical protein